MDWGVVVLIILGIVGAALIVGGFVAYRGSRRTGVRAFGAAGAAAGIVMWVIILMALPISSSDNKSPSPSVVTVGVDSTITEDKVMTLLTEEDVRRVLTAQVPLTTRFYDYKSLAGADAAQVENMDRWYGLVVGTAEGDKGITLSVMDFDSAASAQDHFERMKAEMKSESTPGMRDILPPIGNAALEVEVNAQGIGSILVFLNGDNLVQLHTSQPDDQESLLSLEGLKELAELVASRL